MNTTRKYPEEDIDAILDASETSFKRLAGSKVALLGGTGFIGSWLTEAFVAANCRLNLGINISIFTRNLSRARARFLYLDSSDFNLMHVDFKNSRVRPTENFDIYVNGATPAIAATGLNDDELVWNATVNSSQFIVDSALKFENVPRVLNLSSGAANETFCINPVSGESYFQKFDSIYAKAKIESENILFNAQNNGIIDLANARLYAFLGPGLALDQHFAIGNFIQNVVLRQKITVTGNPKTIRSYLYPTDLIICLISLMADREHINCNVGGTIEFEMRQIAKTVARLGSVDCDANGDSTKLITHYSPQRGRQSVNLPLLESIDLELGIRKWLSWLQVN